MASTFIDRNKRKSVLAFLLLLFKRRKGVIALLLLVVFLFGLFAAPRNWASLMVSAMARFPGGAQAAAMSVWLAGKLGVRLEGLEERRSFGELLAALKAAREQPLFKWSASGSAKSGGYQSSIGLVRGDSEELVTDMSAKVKGGNTVSGVLTPSDAGEREQGVAINRDELGGQREGLVREANAGGVGGLSRAGRMDAGGAFASKAFCSGSAAAAGRDPLKTALDGTQVPGFRRGVAGRISALSKGTRASRMNAYNANYGRRKVKALAQLAQGRVHTQLARECGTMSNCPYEYAAINAGAIYDGNRAGDNSPQYLSAQSAGAPASVDGISGANPNVASQGYAGNLVNEADQIEEDAAACAESDKKYLDPQTGCTAVNQQQIQCYSNVMNNMNCGGGGCSRSKERRCRAVGDLMSASCCCLDRCMQDQWNACPLRRQQGPYKNQDCRYNCGSVACSNGALAKRCEDRWTTGPWGIPIYNTQP